MNFHILYHSVFLSKDINEKVHFSDLRLTFIDFNIAVFKSLAQQTESNGDNFFSSESFEYPDCDLLVAWQIASLSGYVLKIVSLMCLFFLASNRWRYFESHLLSLFFGSFSKLFDKKCLNIFQLMYYICKTFVLTFMLPGSYSIGIPQIWRVLSSCLLLPLACKEIQSLCRAIHCFFGVLFNCSVFKIPLN